MFTMTLTLSTVQVPGVIPVLGWTTYHGMDKVWRRLNDDNILIRFQTLRIKKMIGDLFVRPDSISDSDVRFLELLVKKVSRTETSSFTVLVLNQLLAAIQSNGHHRLSSDTDPFSPRRRAKPRRNPIREILPDNYLGATAGYSQADVDRMLALSKDLDKVGFALRAGLAVHPGAVDGVAELLAGPSAGRFLVVGAEPTDREGRNEVNSLVGKVGAGRILMELAGAKEEKQQRIPEPKEPRGSSLAAPATNTPNMLAVSLVCFLLGLA